MGLAFLLSGGLILGLKLHSPLDVKQVPYRLGEAVDVDLQEGD